MNSGCVRTVLVSIPECSGCKSASTHHKLLKTKSRKFQDTWVIMCPKIRPEQKNIYMYLCILLHNMIIIVKHTHKLQPTNCNPDNYHQFSLSQTQTYENFTLFENLKFNIPPPPKSYGNGTSQTHNPWFTRWVQAYQPWPVLEQSFGFEITVVWEM